jgi:hypothetical protein
MRDIEAADNTADAHIKRRAVNPAAADASNSDTNLSESGEGAKSKAEHVLSAIYRYSAYRSVQAALAVFIVLLFISSMSGSTGTVSSVMAAPFEEDGRSAGSGLGFKTVPVPVPAAGAADSAEAHKQAKAAKPTKPTKTTKHTELTEAGEPAASPQQHPQRAEPSSPAAASAAAASPLLRGEAIDCAFVDTLHDGIDSGADAAGSSKRGSDPAFYSALREACASPIREQLSARVVPAYLDQYRRLTEGSGWFQEAYVSFAFGDKYGPLAYWALKAVMELSERPVVMFASGHLATNAAAHWPLEDFQRLVVLQMPPPKLHAWFDKLRAILLAPVDRGVIIEADTLITMHADRLFDILVEHGGPLPLLPGHADVRWPSGSCASYSGPKTCSAPFAYPLEERTMDYVHAHVMWTAESKPFFSSVLAVCGALNGGQKPPRPRAGRMLDCSSDEAALNYALWNAKATKQLCFMDPHYNSLESWEHNDYAQHMPAFRHKQYIHRTVARMFVHGAKEPQLAEQLLSRIKNIPREHPWISEPPDGTVWTNDVSRAKRSDGCIL